MVVYIYIYIPLDTLMLLVNRVPDAPPLAGGWVTMGTRKESPTVVIHCRFAGRCSSRWSGFYIRHSEQVLIRFLCMQNNGTNLSFKDLETSRKPKPCITVY